MGHALASIPTWRFLILFFTIVVTLFFLNFEYSSTSCWFKFTLFFPPHCGLCTLALYLRRSIMEMKQRLICSDVETAVCLYAHKTRVDSQWNGWRCPNSRMPDSLTLSMPTWSGNTSTATWWTYHCLWRTPIVKLEGKSMGAGRELGVGDRKSQYLKAYHKKKKRKKK